MPLNLASTVGKAALQTAQSAKDLATNARQMVLTDRPKFADLVVQVQGLADRMDAVTNGTNGRDGVDGTNGTNGLAGKDGLAGTNGKDGLAGKNGTDGTNGTNGKDGAAGTVVSKGSASKTVVSVLGIGSTTTVNVPLTPPMPAAGVPQITVYGAPGAYVASRTRKTDGSLDVVIGTTQALSLSSVINVDVQAV